MALPPRPQPTAEQVAAAAQARQRIATIDAEILRLKGVMLRATNPTMKTQIQQKLQQLNSQKDAESRKLV